MEMLRWSALMAVAAAGAWLQGELPSSQQIAQPRAARLPAPATWPWRGYMPAGTAAQVPEPAQPLTPAVWPQGEYLPSGIASRLPATEAYRGRLPEGYLAMSMTLDADQLMFVKPDDRLDILATMDRPGKGKDREKITATLLKRVKVLDVRKSESGAAKSVVLVALNPNEGQYLALAIEIGSVRVLLRRQGDLEEHPMELASFRNIFR